MASASHVKKYDDNGEQLREILARTSISAVYERVTQGKSPNGLRTSRGLMVACPMPSHADSEPSCSLSERTQQFHLFCCDFSGPAGGSKNGGGILDLIVISGAAPNRGKAAIWLKESGLSGASYDISDAKKLKSLSGGGKRDPLLRTKVTGEYPYRNPSGRVMYRVTRIEGVRSSGKAGKRFDQDHPHYGPDGSDSGECISCAQRLRDMRMEADGQPELIGAIKRQFRVDEKRARAIAEVPAAPAPPHGPKEFRLGTIGIPRVPYRSDEVVAAAKAGKSIFMVEGEKKADALWAMGIPATTNMGGAEWPIPASWAKYFEGSPLIIVMPDLDAPGRLAATRRISLLRDAGLRATVFDLGLSRWDKYDIADWDKERKELPLEDRCEELRKAYTAARELTTTKRALIIETSDDAKTVRGVPYDFAKPDEALKKLEAHAYYTIHIGKKTPKDMAVLKPLIEKAFDTGVKHISISDDMPPEAHTLYKRLLAMNQPGSFGGSLMMTAVV